jgi:hypothetical protein
MYRSRIPTVPQSTDYASPVARALLLHLGFVLGIAFLHALPAHAISGHALLSAGGSAANDRVGYSVASAGDFDGDGRPDVMAGGPTKSTGAGVVLLYSGAKLGGTPLSFSGGVSDSAGLSIASAGDFNGDGYDDVIIGAPGSDVGGTSRGQAYLCLGGPVPNLAPDLVFLGEAAGDQFGWSVAGGRDLNGDGFDDLVIGAPSNDAGGSNSGRAYVFLGSSTPNATIDGAFTGVLTNDAFGTSVAIIGDLNRDGYADALIGAPLNDAGAMDGGAAYVFYGGVTVNGAIDHALLGTVAADHFGTSVASLGDWNGDGDIDLAIGAPDADLTAPGAGAVFVYRGGPDMDVAVDVVLTGTSSADGFGIAVSSAGDVNHDGYADALVGARLAGSTSNNDGLAYIYLGGQSPDATSDLILSPAAEAEAYGTAVAAAGDVDGDDYADVLVGDPADVLAGTNSGRFHLYAIYPYQIVVPSGGDVWPQHARVTVMWRGHDPADLELSLDAGASFEALALSKGGLDINSHTVSLPDLPLSLDTDNTAMIRVKFTGQTATNATSVVSRAFRVVHVPRSIEVTGQVALRVEPPTLADTVHVAKSVDIDRDGTEDLILGMPASNSGAGKVMIYLATSRAASGAPEYRSPPITLALGNPGDAFGWAIATGDVNGDCYPDIAIASPNADPPGKVDGGSVAVVFGDGIRGNAPPIGASWVVEGAAAGDRLGYSLALADMNGDGYADLAAGAPFADTPSGDAGQVRIYHGSPTPDASSDLVLTGEAGGDNFGTSLAGMPDPDSPIDWCEIFPWICPVISGALLVGSPFNDFAALNAGAAYLYAGGSAVDGMADLVMRGTSADARFGMTVANLGDFNGDRIPDLAIGAPGGDCFDPPCPPDAGLVYVRLFDPRCFVINPWPTEPDPWFLVVEGDGTGDLFGQSLAATDINHDGLSDLVVAAPFHDGPKGVDQGRVYAYWGRVEGTAQGIDPRFVEGVDPDFVADGSAALERFGRVLGATNAANPVQPPDIANGEVAQLASAASPALIRRRCWRSSASSQPAAANASRGAVPALIDPEIAPTPMVGGDLMILGDNGNLEFHDLNRFHLLSPAEGRGSMAASGTVWSVGSTQSISWRGSEPAAIQLSTNGGASYQTIATSPGGPASNSARFTVPDLPAGFGDLRIIPWPPCPPCPNCLTCPPFVGFAQSGRLEIARYSRPIAVATAVGVTLTASASVDTGHVAKSADINADGLEDLIVGAPFAGGGAGRVRVYLGIDRTASGRPKFQSTPIDLAPSANPDAFGWSLAIGDVNGDCTTDLAVGAPRTDPSGITDAGRVYTYFGGTSFDTSPDWVVDGGLTGEQLGYAVALVADMSGDHYDDLAAGAPLSNVSGTGSGRVRIFHGGTAPDATSDLDLNGAALGDNFGISLTSLPGEEGGIDWCEIFPWICPVISGALAVGAPFHDGVASNAGAVFVFAGGTGADAAADVSMYGDQAEAHFGLALATLADFDGDRLSDLAIAAPDQDRTLPDPEPDAGRVYVRRIDPRCLLINPPCPDPWPGPWLGVFTGEAANDHFGQRITSTDLNHDGLSDLVVAAPLHDGPAGTDAGRISGFWGEVGLIDWVGDPNILPNGEAGGVIPDFLIDGASPAERLGEVLGATEALKVQPQPEPPSPSGIDLARIRSRCQRYPSSVAAARGGQSADPVGAMGHVGPPEAPPPMLGGDLMVGRLGTAPELRLYDVNRYQMMSPVGSATWSVGSLQKISWKGSEPAAIQLSVDGGATYTNIAESPGGNALNVASVRVPHLPTRFGTLRIVPWPPCPPCPGCLTCPPWVGFAQSETLLTIQTSVSLLTFTAQLTETGAELAWSTDPGPGPEGLAGYRLYRRESGAEGEGSRIGPELIAENHYLDRDGRPGTSYRLAAVNGLGEELEVGEASLDFQLAALRAWPSPVARHGTVSVSFGAPLVAPGVVATDLDVGVFDVVGRRVATLANGYAQPKAGLVKLAWPVTDRGGNTIHPGLYFVRAVSPSAGMRMERKVVVMP